MVDKKPKPLEYSQLNEFGNLYKPPQFTDNDRNHFFIIINIGHRRETFNASCFQVQRQDQFLI